MVKKAQKTQKTHYNEIDNLKAKITELEKQNNELLKQLPPKEENPSSLNKSDTGRTYVAKTASGKSGVVIMTKAASESGDPSPTKKTHKTSYRKDCVRKIFK